MAQSDDLRDLAFQLIDEAAGGRESAAIVAGFKKTVEALQKELSPLMGHLAVRMLFTRSVSRAARHYPFLEEDISVYEEGIEVGDLLAHEADLGAAVLRDALGGLLATFLAFLTELLGKDLAKRFVMEAMEDKANEGPE